MIKIGNVTPCNNIFLAPMAGVTDLAFRLMCKRMGAGMVYSEMVSSKALHYNDKKTLTLLETREEESPLAVQIFGSDPDCMAEAAQKVASMGAPIIDINFGCPAPKVTSGGDGSALLRDFALIGRITEAVARSVDVPVTAKIRCGIKEFVDVAELGHIIQESGAKAIAVHGRTAAMYYSGVADWSKIAQVKAAVSIPVIGNGDVASGEDAKRMFEQTGCDGIMIGRGAEGNPFIFAQINEYLTTGEVRTNPDNLQKLSVMKEHIALLTELKGERTGVREARKHVAWYTKGMKGGAAIRNEVCKTESLEKLNDIIDRYMNDII